MVVQVLVVQRLTNRQKRSSRLRNTGTISDRSVALKSFLSTVPGTVFLYILEPRRSRYVVTKFLKVSKEALQQIKVVLKYYDPCLFNVCLV